MDEIRAGIRVVKKKNVDRLLAWPNVTAVDINHKTVSGQKTDQMCLVIWVKNKKPESEIPPNEILPKEIDGVPVDVFEGEAKLGEGFSWPETQSTAEQQSNVAEPAALEVQKLRPLDTLRGGDSLSPNTATYAGTLGYFVKQKNAIGILSNAHVMGSIGAKLISPAPRDGGKPGEDYIGTVKSTVVSTAVDCGYAPLRGKITKFKLKDGTSVKGTQAARVGTHIRFYGRTSGAVTRGAVVSIDWSGTISGKTYHDQIMLSVGVQPGDSGSLLLDRDDDEAIGLNFAEAGGHGLANHIGDVLSALGVEIAI